MKTVAAMLLALMLSACNPELIDYPSAHFDLLDEDRGGVRVPGPGDSPVPAETGGKTRGPVLAPGVSGAIARARPSAPELSSTPARGMMSNHRTLRHP
ncbi:hypothetical protein [Pseudomonas sp. CGJS7]|uniref:hypothetical protein n=1 Tax=Pseudomonas sp. CGJS7 TaxID=3109348 RepID=UPI00300A4D1E